MKLSKNRNVKIISRPCWCPHQHAHTGPALRALPPRSPSARVGVLTNTLTQGTQLHPSRRSSRGTKRSHGMSAFTREPRKKHLAQSRAPLPSSALTFRPCWCPHQHAHAAQVTPMLTQIILNK